MTTGGRCNALYYDDNLHVLRESIASESADGVVALIDSKAETPKHQAFCSPRVLKTVEI